MARVVLAMSGGVDSSVAAHLLRAAGHEVIGLFMKHGEKSPVVCASPSDAESSTVGTASLPIVNAPASHRQGCCSASDALDARRVADELDIPFYALNFEEQFAEIIDYFVDEYTSGRTPNPCVVCNTWLKFGALWDYAQSVGAQFIATGHYARLLPPVDSESPPALCRGVDEAKDQSYVLFGIKRKLLPNLLFPVGGHSKPEIRRLAGQLNLRVAEKRDSQEICFVPDRNHAQFVKQHLADRDPTGMTDRSGEIVTSEGHVVGHHRGLEQFTIGQRKGLGIALGEPHYVLRIEPGPRRVVIGKRNELACRQLTADRANWLVDPASDEFACEVKIRYNSPPAPAQVQLCDEGGFRVEFREPQYGVAPGQAVVCYDGPRVLGGGWIN